MQCNVCQRSCNNRLPFNCASCAQAVLYQTRLRLAHALLDQEAASSQVERTLKESQVTTLKQSVTSSSKEDNKYGRLALEASDVHIFALEERMQIIHNSSEALRADVLKNRDEIRDRKAFNATKRKEIAAAKQELTRRETADIAPVTKIIGRLQSRWDVLHTRTAESRLLLCKEAAALCGLQKHRKRDTKPKADTYIIGGLPIFHLRELNNVDPIRVSTVNAIVAHLIHLLSHYLSLRLPAEITLPHGDYPFPTILPPATSYTGLNVPFPNTMQSHSSSNSPSASRSLQAEQTPRSRPLFLQKPLAVVAKDEPQTCVAFVEGTALLAWNIAWLCKSQGIGVGDDSWEEICDIGRNLWKLVAAQPTSARSTSASHERRTKQDSNINPAPPIPRSNQQYPTDTRSISFGQYSHNTVHSNLTSAAGSDYMRRWRLHDPQKVVDRVQHVLQSERTGSGWEILEDKEWETGSVAPNSTRPTAVVEASTVVVNSGAEPFGSAQAPKSSPTEASQDRTKGTSGWTKLKSR